MLHLDAEVDLFWFDQLLLFAKMRGLGMQVHPHVKVLTVNLSSVCTCTQSVDEN